ncbi:hypothetical protein B0H13DRAFT_2354296 [Mycena leptocephala]|nr:hypothetical protein B0H13DRAFT_2354296 [Mycena leptocephala]
MAPSATFCNSPLSTSVNPLSERSLLSVDWLLTAGIPAPGRIVSGVLTLPSGDSVSSMHMKLSVAAGLAHDLVLGRDWLAILLSTNYAACLFPSFVGYHPPWTAGIRCTFSHHGHIFAYSQRRRSRGIRGRQNITGSWTWSSM